MSDGALSGESKISGWQRLGRATRRLSSSIGSMTKTPVLSADGWQDAPAVAAVTAEERTVVIKEVIRHSRL
jgi:hypothetical protein